MPTEQAIRRSALALDNDWWRGAAIYQIYPRSFADTTGDGVGDLPGITRHLDHVAALGVDAVWLSPFFPSPMHDFGYDVADYCDVDPMFGTLADFDALVDRAHALGLRVLIDQVYSHSSIDHEWFRKSRSSRDNDKADWYVWADAKPDGSPPSNWQSVFGGPAWTWDARRGQYYLHNFLPEQPDLNVHNRAVRDALLGVAQFWLDRGVDGFRIDALNFAMHDPLLRDNPPAINVGKRTRPFDFQQHLFNQSHPGIVGFIEELQALIDRYPGRFSLAEVGGDNALAEMHMFTAGEGRLDSAYGFDFLYADQLTPKLVEQVAAAWPNSEGKGWPSWAFENHDAPRAVSRWAGTIPVPHFCQTKMLLLTALRGSMIIYQGEELGLTQVDVPFDRLRDPEAIANWPQTLSRDGARTPMPWRSDSPNLGFSTGEPWLPFGSGHGELAVDRQTDDPNSLITFTRHCLALRHEWPALRQGSMTIIEASEQVLRFVREDMGQRVMCTFNLSDSASAWSGRSGQQLIAAGQIGDAELGAWSAIVESVD